jgi:hypothetical protein
LPHQCGLCAWSSVTCASITIGRREGKHTMDMSYNELLYAVRVSDCSLSTEPLINIELFRMSDRDSQFKFSSTNCRTSDFVLANVMFENILLTKA